MKSILIRLAVRGGGFALLAAILLAGLPASADVVKGAGLQRQLAQAKSTTRGALTRTDAVSCPACCPSNQAAGETIVVTTGSQLPTVSKKRLQITDGGQNLLALDRKQLERTGAISVTEAVRRLVP